MDELEKLVATNEILKVKARYFRCMDQRDWDCYEACFTDDCEFDVSLADIVPEIGTIPDHSAGASIDGWVQHGAKAIRKFVSELLVGIRTVHHGHMAEIEIESPTRATAIFAMEDLLDYPPGYPQSHVRGHGHYYETYEKVDSQWKIRSLRLTRLRVERI